MHIMLRMIDTTFVFILRKMLQEYFNDSDYEIKNRKKY